MSVIVGLNHPGIPLFGHMGNFALLYDIHHLPESVTAIVWLDGWVNVIQIEHQYVYGKHCNMTL